MNAIPKLDAFPVHPRPADGESLMGYVWRVFSANGHRVPAEVRSAVEDVRCGPPSAQKTAWLQATLGERVREPALREQSAQDAYRRGPALNWHRWLGTGQHCPACIAETSAHRTLFDLPLVSACPVHQLMLIRACPKCDRALRWTELKWPWACACGTKIARMAAEAAPKWQSQLAARLETALRTGDPGALDAVYQALAWLVTLRYVVTYFGTYRLPLSGTPVACRRPPGRWECQVASLGAEELCRRGTRAAARLLRDERGPLIAVGDHDRFATVLELVNRLRTRSAAGLPQVVLAADLFHERHCVGDTAVGVMYHPGLSAVARATLESRLCGWWRSLWQRSPTSRAGALLRSAAQPAMAPLVVSLVNSLARLADQGIARPAVLSVRWRLSEAVAMAGQSLPSLLRALATLQPMELAFASLCAEHDLWEAKNHA